ncbi:hypothetical protein KKF84_17920, partial [Myxococcota bacterium]|nr:hypothetical protein [Myxococcota bacterium]
MAKCFFRKPLFIMLLGAALLCPFITGCDDDDEIDLTRYDTAVQLDIVQDGSVQNPAWSPDSSELVVTVFREGYNE